MALVACCVRCSAVCLRCLPGSLTSVKLTGQDMWHCKRVSSSSSSAFFFFFFSLEALRKHTGARLEWVQGVPYWQSALREPAKRTDHCSTVISLINKALSVSFWSHTKLIYRSSLILHKKWVQRKIWRIWICPSVSLTSTAKPRLVILLLKL